MKIKHHHIIATFLIFRFSAFAQTEKTLTAFQKVTLDRTEIRIIHSNIVGQDYELFISLPNSYSLKDTYYPVIFLMDSYRSFSIVKGITDGFTIPHTIIPEVVIVGVGYGGEGMEALKNWGVGRNQDLTPVQDSLTASFIKNTLTKLGFGNTCVRTGGAHLFLDFMRLELLPFIESNYRIDPNQRILIGYSFGGLFGLYTIFHHPELFSKYLIGSPSLHYKKEISFEFEASYADTHFDLAADVFISCGSLEQKTAKDVKRMTELLFSRGYKSLSLEKVIFENEDHITCFPASVSRGLVDLFNN